jgi:energy-coupling factor transporter ATP-binding protein EcfA2
MKRSKRGVYLTELALKNIKSFAGEQSLYLTTDRGAPARWTLLIGENGVGKTTLLECLARLTPVFNSGDASGADDPRLFIEPEIAHEENSVIYALGRVGDNACEMQATFSVDSILDREAGAETVVPSLSFTLQAGKSDDIAPSRWPEAEDDAVPESEWGAFSRFEEPLVLAYGAGRHMGVGNLDFSSAAGPRDSLLNGETELFDAEEMILNLDYASLRPGATKAAKRQKEVLLATIAALLPEVESPHNIEIHGPGALGSKGARGVGVRTKDGEVPLRQLSYGYQTMMAWVFDIGWRLFEHYPNVKAPLEQPAIVLIDELDLHLHPSWQREVRGRLSTHFPNVQFVATAHSPLIAQAFLDANLAVVMRDGDHSIIENDPVKVANWRVDQIVTSELFGLDSPWPPAFDALFREQRTLLDKHRRSAAENQRLKAIEAELLKLPTESDGADDEAMRFLREAAAKLVAES